MQEAVTIYNSLRYSKNIAAVTFGQGDLNLDIPVYRLGQLSEDSLALAYSAADAYVSLSREDVGPMTVGESLLCGTPVVGFPIGILPEIAEHKSTAYFAEPFDAADIGKGIYWILEAVENDMDIGKRCRQAAKKYCDPSLSARRHKSLYEKMLKNCKNNNLHGTAKTEQAKDSNYTELGIGN